MCIHPIKNVGVTVNGNSYKKTNAGKKAGVCAGVAYVATGTAVCAKKGLFNRPLAKVMVNLRNLGVKHPKMATYGAVGAGVLLALAIVTGVGKLIGAGVDKIINSRRAKAADKAAEV